LFSSSVDGEKANVSDYDVLQELNLICSMCNDSSIDYNEMKHIYEKVGEPTEVALIVLVEKMNIPGLKLSDFSKSERAHACNNAISEGYKKVNKFFMEYRLLLNISASLTLLYWWFTFA